MHCSQKVFYIVMLLLNAHISHMPKVKIKPPAVKGSTEGERSILETSLSQGELLAWGHCVKTPTSPVVYLKSSAVVPLVKTFRRSEFIRPWPSHHKQSFYSQTLLTRNLVSSLSLLSNGLLINLARFLHTPGFLNLDCASRQQKSRTKKWEMCSFESLSF